MGFEVFTKDAAKFLRDAFWGTINERIKSGIKRNDLLDLLIEVRKKQQDTGDFGDFSELKYYLLLIVIFFDIFRQTTKKVFTSLLTKR